ncbi:hypothetical protein AB0451_36815 [Streptomyces sp. NPDC052000]|uniref:hypothetical protein n=1 Tax=Streptomyces sp. NPDC052000 TaxID=3155676 RepID=UPI00344BE2A0
MGMWRAADAARHKVVQDQLWSPTKKMRAWSASDNPLTPEAAALLTDNAEPRLT